VLTREVILSRRLLTAAVLLALPGVTVRAAERWIEVRSPHIQVIANTGAGAARRLARRLEAFHVAVSGLVPGPGAGAGTLTTVILLDHPSSMAPLYPLYEGKRRPIGGLFAQGDDRNYVVVATKANETLLNAYHEYTHVLLARAGPRLPLWLGEGLSDLYSTAEVGEREVVIGRPLTAHVRLLKEGGLLPLDALFRADQDSPEYNEAGRQDRFYAQSWALAHFAFIGSGRGPALMEALLAGRPSAEAFTSALDLPPERLQKALAAYVGRLAYPATRATVPPLAEGALHERPVEEREALFHRGDCLAHLGRMDDARPFLEKAIALSPSYAPPYRAMGLAHYHVKDYAGAVRWLSGAIERDPADAFARYLRATAAVQQAGRSYGPAAAAGVREDLLVATAGLPDLPEPWQLLAHADSVLGRIDDDAVRTLRRALELAPGRTDLQQRLELVLARRGEGHSP
jgi:tetratricopeptide (TPR) repeat protein